MTNSINTAHTTTDVAKIIEDSIFWFEQRIEQLNDILDYKGNIVLALGDDEDDRKFNDDESAAFRAGIATAISIIGKFPLSLNGTVDPVDINELEDND